MKNVAVYITLLMFLSSCTRMAFYEPPVPIYEDLYIRGGGFVGENITISKDGEFIFYPWTDIITDSVVYYSGKYSSSDSIYNFELQHKHIRKRLFKHLPGYRTSTISYSNSKDTIDLFEEAFYVIRWDHLEYLIPKSKLAVFIHDVNRQIEPRIESLFYFQICCFNYTEVPKSLYPEVPKKYKSKLNKNTISASIKEIESDSVIVVNLDSFLELIPGQMFFDNELVYIVIKENRFMVYDKIRSIYIDRFTDEVILGNYISLTDENLIKYDISVGKHLNLKMP